MEVTFAAFREQFPEEPPTAAFVGVAQGAIEAAIKEALQLHDKRNLATLYLVGHLLALDQEYYDALWRRKDRPDGGSGVVNCGANRAKENFISDDGGRKRTARVFRHVAALWPTFFLALEDRTPSAMAISAESCLLIPSIIA